MKWERGKDIVLFSISVKSSEFVIAVKCDQRGLLRLAAAVPAVVWSLKESATNQPVVPRSAMSLGSQKLKRSHDYYGNQDKRAKPAKV